MGALMSFSSFTRKNWVQNDFIRRLSVKINDVELCEYQIEPK